MLDVRVVFGVLLYCSQRLLESFEDMSQVLFLANWSIVVYIQITHLLE